MEAFVTGLHIILCFFLILVVLLQPGKTADFGAMMGGSSQAGGSAAQGTSLIGKLTSVVAGLFMVTSMTLAWLSNRPEASVISDEALQEELKELGEGAADATPPAVEEEPEEAPGEAGSAAGDEGSAAGDEGSAAGEPGPPQGAGGAAPGAPTGGDEE